MVSSGQQSAEGKEEVGTTYKGDGKIGCNCPDLGKLVIMYGYDTLVTTPRIRRVLGRFQHRMDRTLTRKATLER